MIFSRGMPSDCARRASNSSLTPCIETRWNRSVTVVSRHDTSNSFLSKIRYRAMALSLPDDQEKIAFGCSSGATWCGIVQHTSRFYPQSKIRGIQATQKIIDWDLL